MKKRKHTLRLLKLAEDDLDDIITYVAEDRPSAANKLLSRIEKRLLELRTYPYMGKIPADEELSHLGYRYLVVDNYMIFYTIESRTIIVHRIIHGAREFKGFL